MKRKIEFVIVFFLALNFIFFSSCKRNAIEEPSPLGPSSLSIILNVSASPNVLFASETREITTITANLKKYDGTSLSNKTIYFEIRDASGNRANVGYFDGNQLIKSKVTDGNGMVSVNYYGPLSQELNDNATLYIYASVAWEGKESISESCPLYIIRDVTAIDFELAAKPNVLFAGDTREASTITATLTTAAGVPLANQTIHFEITDANGDKTNVGYFESNQLVVTKVTDQNGKVTTTYYGPLAEELTQNTTIYIAAHVAWEGCDTYPSSQCGITIIRDVTESTLEISAQPNVLFAGESHEASTIRATLKTAGGAPLANQTIHFEINDVNGNQVNIGYFEGNQLVVTKVTDQNGMATTTYYGPLSEEITTNTTVYIAGSVAREGDEFLSATAAIQIIRDVTGATLKLNANPNVLFAGESHEASTIRATLKTAGGAPLANQTIHFQINDVNGNQVNIGYFEGNQLVVTKVTDQDGMATTTYYGPLSEELTQNTTVYIAGNVAREGDDFLSATAAIQIIRDITGATLKLNANPNVLFAGESHEASTITATLKTPGGAPLANKVIHFEIHDVDGNKVNIGYFEGNQSVVTKFTDQNGRATTTYYGPRSEEITTNATVYIAGTVEWQGDTVISDTASIYIIRDITEITLSVSAHPNVLIAGSGREKSTIIAILKTAAGAPLADFLINFEIHDVNGNPLSLGYFEGNQSVVAKGTDQNGVASTTYYGPLASEIAGNTSVYISATLEYEGDTIISDTARIDVIRKTTVE